MKNQPRKGTTGLIRPASMVAMGPARALTSHVRSHYHGRYKGRYRFAALVFVFDACLVLVACALLAFDLALLLSHGKVFDGGIALDLIAPPLRASDAMPIQAVLRSTDGKTHDDVLFHWVLPEWVEIVSSTPRIPADGMMRIGRLAPGDEWTSHLIVRIRAPKGTQIPFGFLIRQFDPFFLRSQLTGTENRSIVQAALTATPAVQATHAVLGASIPILVANSGNATAKAAVLRLVTSDGAPEAALGTEGTLLLGDLSPGERRVAYIELGQTAASSVALTWELQDGAQVVDTQHATYALVSITHAPDVTATSAADHLSLTTRSTGAWSLLIDHPRLWSEPSLLPLTSGSYATSVSLDASKQGNDWSYLAIDESLPGGILTSRHTETDEQRFPSVLEARYYAASGDQLGIGPLPPRVGQATTYWVVWTLGPTDAPFSSVHLAATLPDGVTPTGKFASTVDGLFSTDGPIVHWDIPSLPAIGRAELPTFAFEVSLTPNAAQANTSPTLVTSAQLEATAVSGNVSHAEFGSLSTDLTTDEKAAGLGAVQP